MLMFSQELIQNKDKNLVSSPNRQELIRDQEFKSCLSRGL